MPNAVLYEKELKDRFPYDIPAKMDTQLRRIVNSPDSEDLLTWNVFRPLCDIDPKAKWLSLFLEKSFQNTFVKSSHFAVDENDLNGAIVRFWHGRKTKEYYPPSEHQHWLSARLKDSPIPKYRQRSAIARRLEGPTEVDLVIETDALLIFVEAKYLSVISCQTSYDLCRDQITRNLDVGMLQAQRACKKFYFILLTPEYFERNRLYWYKMKDYIGQPELLKERLSYLSFDHVELSKSIGWILWRDVIEIWKGLKSEFQVSSEDRDSLPLVLRHFEEAGLL